jgi:hypothetical protein
VGFGRYADARCPGAVPLRSSPGLRDGELARPAEGDGGDDDGPSGELEKGHPIAQQQHGEERAQERLEVRVQRGPRGTHAVDGREVQDVGDAYVEKGRTAERPIRAPVEDPVPADSSQRQGFEQELAQAATHALNAGLGAPPV